MGTYIRTCAEIKTADGWQPVGYGAFPPELWHDMDGYEAPAYSEPFKDQNYGMFGLFAGERNYSQCQVLAEPRGFPDDISPCDILCLKYGNWKATGAGVSHHRPRSLNGSPVRRQTATGIRG